MGVVEHGDLPRLWSQLHLGERRGAVVHRARRDRLPGVGLRPAVGTGGLDGDTHTSWRAGPGAQSVRYAAMLGLLLSDRAERFKMDPTPQTVQDVVRRLQQIQNELPPADGVRWFNHLYLEVVEAVATTLDSASFADPAFIRCLDVLFSGYYFRALDAASARAGSEASCWGPLFQNRLNGEVAPIQFALCGANAHINHDLVMAIVDAYDAMGGAGAVSGPDHSSDRYRDFCNINQTLSDVESRVKQWFDAGLVGELDHAFANTDNLIAHWSLVDAREAAWSSAEVLWALRGNAVARDLYLTSLDHLVGFAGRGLLVSA